MQQMGGQSSRGKKAMEPVISDFEIAKALQEEEEKKAAVVDDSTQIIRGGGKKKRKGGAKGQ